VDRDVVVAAVLDVVRVRRIAREETWILSSLYGRPDHLVGWQGLRIVLEAHSLDPPRWKE
jgi:hypothetical protein